MRFSAKNNPWFMMTVCVAMATPVVQARDATEVNSSSELDRRISSLEERLDRLSQSRRDVWLAEVHSTEMRRLIEETIADADNSANVLKSNPRVFYNNGFSLRSSDNRFRANFAGELQVRYVFNHQSNSPDDNDRGGFEIRRLLLRVDGFVIDPTWRYTIINGFLPDGRFFLSDAYLKKSLTDSLDLMAGRFRPEFLKEQIVSNRFQLLAERSLIARAFGERYGAGTQILWETKYLRTAAAFVSDRAAFVEMPMWRVSARVQGLLVGDWNHLRDLTSWPQEKPTIAVGAGVRYDESDPIGPFVRDTHVFGWTVDASIELGGVSMMAALVANNPGVSGEGQAQLHQYGVVVQGGVFVAKDWELVARYEWGDADGLAEDLSIATVGVTHYFARHTIKWTNDVGYGLNEARSEPAVGAIALACRTDRGAQPNANAVLNSTTHTIDLPPIHVPVVMRVRGGLPSRGGATERRRACFTRSCVAGP